MVCERRPSENLGAVLVLVASVMAWPVQQYGPETWFEQDPAPVPIHAESIGNPLDYAAARIGLDVRHVELPRGWEGGYRYCCRVPLIDLVASRPLFMKQWAEDVSEDLIWCQRSDGILAAGCGYNEFCKAVSCPFSLGNCGDWSSSPPDSIPLAGCEQTLAAHGFTHTTRAKWQALCGAMTRAWKATREARAGLSPEDSAFFARNPGYYLAPDGKRMPELTGDRTQQEVHRESARSPTQRHLSGRRRCRSGGGAVLQGDWRLEEDGRVRGYEPGRARWSRSMRLSGEWRYPVTATTRCTPRTLPC